MSNIEIRNIPKARKRTLKFKILISKLSAVCGIGGVVVVWYGTSPFPFNQVSSYEEVRFLVLKSGFCMAT